MINAFILCDLVWKVQKSHEANREGSFNDLKILQIVDIPKLQQLKFYFKHAYNHLILIIIWKQKINKLWIIWTQNEQ